MTTDDRPASANNAIAIEIIGVHKWYGAFHVLRDIDLTRARAASGSSICGPSGSGKSTLIRCINRSRSISAARSSSTASS